MRRITSAVVVLSFLGSLSIALAQTRPAATGVWAIDAAKSEVRFNVTKLGFEDVTGVFRESEGEIRYDPARPADSAITWRVRVASVLTDATSRDRTLQAPEYFDAAHHPLLIFQSRRVRALEGGRLEVTGDITIRGVTRPLTLEVRLRAGVGGPIFETDFQIDRYDFGVAGSTFFGRLIGSRVRVQIVAATMPVGPLPRLIH